MLSWRTSRRLGALGLVLAVGIGGVVATERPGDAPAARSAAPSATPTTPATPTSPAPSTGRPTTPAPPAQPDPVPAAPPAKVTTRQVAVPTATAGTRRDAVASLPKTRVASFGMVGVTWSAETTERDISVRIRTLQGSTWSGWQDLELQDDQPGEGGRPGTEAVWVGKAEGVAVDVTSASGTRPRDVKVVTIDPGSSAADEQLAASEAAPATGTTTVSPALYAGPVDGVARTTSAAASALPPQPTFISRAAWGASAGTRCDSPTTAPSTKGVVIHHTAGNNTYDRADSTKIVRAAQAYHIKGHGWCDIGYNFLVDKYGQVFEGRKGGITNQVRAAHSGNNEVNTNAMGVSMMGNFDVAEPSAAMKSSVVALVSWRMGRAGIPAKGTWKVREGGLTLNRIAGHRNVVGTACPGKFAYAWISAKDGLRDRVEDALAGTTAPSTTPPPPAPTGVAVTPSTSSATVTWAATTGARTYGLCLVTSATSTSCVRSLSGLTTTTATLDDLAPTGGRDYYVKVRAGNTAGAGAWSELTGFDLVPAVPAAVTGVTVVPSTSSAAISWSAPAGAKTYGVCLVTSSTATSCARSLSGLTTTSTTVTGLKPTAGRDYYVKVRAGNGTTAGPWSALTGFDLKAAATTSQRTAAADTVKVTGSTVVVKGHGFGHGIGMSQYGAQGAARDGVGYATILSTYYPGTKLASEDGTVRVLLTRDTTPAVTVSAASGMKFHRLGGGTITLPTTVGGRTVERWQITPGSVDARRSALQYRTSKGWSTYQDRTWTGSAQFEAASLRLVLPDGSGVNYRGALRSSVPSAGSKDRSTVNVLPLESYVRGVVASEMPSSWQPEALKAQAVAARTYAVRGLAPSRYYDLCDTTSCQVYRGRSGETTATDQAVAATKGKILTYGGKPAFTQYSSSSGGWTAPGSQPYLKAVVDPYDGWSGNANHNWSSTVKVSGLQKAYPKLGTITRITVKDRVGGGAWGGRVATVTVTGSRSSTTITGAAMRFALGLRSAWFAFD